MNNQSSSKPTKRGTPVWAWVLIVLGVLLVGLVIVFIVIVVVGDKPSTKTENQVNAVTNATTTVTAPVTTPDTRNIDAYLIGVAGVLTKINAAVENWTAAAEAGTTGDIVASNAAVNKGIDEAIAGDELYAALVPPSEAATLQSKLKEALALTREALNKALLGNVNEDPEIIQRSKDAVVELVPVLEAVQAEIDTITKLLPAS